MTGFSLNLLLETIHSDVTKENYNRRLHRFQEFIGMELDELILLDIKQIQNMVQGYIIDVKKSISPNSIPSMIIPIKSFLEINDIILNWKKITRFYPHRVRLSGQSAWQTEDIQKMLDVTTKLSTRALIHVLASTGCRVGGVEGLLMEDIRDVDHGCKMIKVYAGDLEEYVTFLTPEASYAVEQYIKARRDDGEVITPKNSLFRGVYSPEPLDRASISMVITRVAENANVRGQMINGRYAVQVCHGFRKRFNTILKLNQQVNDNAIEKMMGHKNGLDGTYLQISNDRLLEEFQKGVIDLTVTNEYRQKLEITSLKKEKDTKMKDITRRMKQMENLMNYKELKK